MLNYSQFASYFTYYSGNSSTRALLSKTKMTLYFNFILLFFLQQGRICDLSPLMTLLIVEAVQEALPAAGFDQSKYCGHSFRIGTATTTTARGMEDADIKILGRWRRLAYLDYIKIPREQLASYFSVLVA